MSSHPHPSPDQRKEASALQCVAVLGQLTALFEERRRQLAESVGLSVQQWQMLEEVQHEHFMPSLFAQQRASSAAAVSKILRQLTNKGLVVPNVSVLDGRKRNYQVTDLGQDLLSQVRAQRKKAIDEVWMRLSCDELGQFAAVGATIVERLDRWAEDQRPKTTKQGDKNGQDALRKGV